MKSRMDKGQAHRSPTRGINGRFVVSPSIHSRVPHGERDNSSRTSVHLHLYSVSRLHRPDERSRLFRSVAGDECRAANKRNGKGALNVCANKNDNRFSPLTTSSAATHSAISRRLQRAGERAARLANDRTKYILLWK